MYPHVVLNISLCGLKYISMWSKMCPYGVLNISLCGHKYIPMWSQIYPYVVSNISLCGLKYVSLCVVTSLGLRNLRFLGGPLFGVCDLVRINASSEPHCEGWEVRRSMCILTLMST